MHAKILWASSSIYTRYEYSHAALRIRHIFCCIGKIVEQLLIAQFPFSEEKKAPLLQMPMSKKREMITMNTKTMARTQYESPNDYIQYLVSEYFCHMDGN